jgi:hypothetical protein
MFAQAWFAEALRRRLRAGYDAELVRWSMVALLAACAGPRALPAPPPGPIAQPGDAERYYAIWLGGSQVGTAHETETWSRTGVVVRRSEALRFRRSDALVELATAIEITADRQLAPSRVTWTETAQTQRRGEAVRDAAGWLVRDRDGVRRLPRAAIPAELAPLVVRRDGRFAGPVFLPARGFIAGIGRIEPVAAHRLIARLALEAGAAADARQDASGEPGAEPITRATADATVEATIDLGADAMPIRVVDGEGVIATRITAAEAERAFEPVDVIAATALPLRGRPSQRLVLELDIALPPVPGQAMRPAEPAAAAPGAPGRRGPIELALSARLPGGLVPGPAGPDRTRAIAALVARVRRRIAPDLAADPTTARTAASAVAGDCSTFALAYAALAAERAIPTEIVTGFRIDGERLVRHRWAVSWTGRSWIAVDAAFGTAPAGGDLVGIAVHGSDDAGLVTGEAALTHVRAARWR